MTGERFHAQVGLDIVRCANTRFPDETRGEKDNSATGAFEVPSWLRAREGSVEQASPSSTATSAEQVL